MTYTQTNAINDAKRVHKIVATGVAPQAVAAARAVHNLKQLVEHATGITYVPEQESLTWQDKYHNVNALANQKMEKIAELQNEVARLREGLNSAHDLIKHLDEKSKPETVVNILHKANDIIYGDREKAYGSPRFNLDTIAQLWSVYMHRRFHSWGIDGLKIEAEDVSQLMILLKTARLISNPTHADSLTDQAGYAALQHRINTPESESKIHCGSNLSEKVVGEVAKDASKGKTMGEALRAFGEEMARQNIYFDDIPFKKVP